MITRDITTSINDISVTEDTVFDVPFTNEDSPGFQNVFYGGLSPSSIIAGDLNEDIQQQAGVLYSGKTAFDNTETGYRLGFDGSTVKFYIGNTTQYLNWTGSALDIAGAISASTIDIGGADTTSFHVDVDGNMWLGAATYATPAPFRVANTGDLDIGGTDATSFHIDSAGNLWWGSDGSYAAASVKISNAGVAAFSDMTITGGAISSTPISSIPNNTSTDISLLEKTWTMTFSVTDADTVAWTTGTITLSNGRTFTIDAGNTGDMTALTYIYLDPGVSSTVLQTTTTAATALGANKILIGTAQNNTVTASFIPYGPGQPLVDGANIGALSIVAGNIAASTITAGKMNVSQLSAIAADMGTITAGTVTGATVQTASSGDRFVMTSTAFQGIETGGNVVFEVLISGANAGDVIMGDDATGSYAIWDDSAGTFEVFADNVPVNTQGTFGGDGSNSSLAITTGTTTLNVSSEVLYVRNYTSISITGDGTLAFSTPATNGTIIILKSQGGVTLTSSATCIDASGMGAAGGAGGTSGGAGSDGSEGRSILDELVHGGDGGDAGATGAGSTGGDGTSAITVNNSLYYTNSLTYFLQRFIRLACGSGGGGGGSGLAADASNTGGAGGNGGGALIIECAGAWNFTTANGISVAGKDGTSKGAASDGTSGGGGGGGGAGGMFLGMYNSVTADSGTVASGGGAGGDGGTGDRTPGGSARSGGAGGEGAGATGGAGGKGGDGVSDNVGGNGDAAGGARAGGGGGAGGGTGDGSDTVAGGSGGSAGSSVDEFIVQNTIYA